MVVMLLVRKTFDPCRDHLKTVQQDSGFCVGGSRGMVAPVSHSQAKASASVTHPETPPRNFYGRLKANRLSKARNAYIEEDLEALSPVPSIWDANLTATPLNLPTFVVMAKTCLARDRFGGGETYRASVPPKTPGRGIIGCEPL